MTTRLAQSVDHRELELGRRRKQKLTDHATDVDGAVTNQFSTVQSTVCSLLEGFPSFQRPDDRCATAHAGCGDQLHPPSQLAL
jgi:hypothetical protein